MKWNYLVVLCISFITITFLPGFKCVKEVEDEYLSGCIKGKLVIVGPCGQYVIQVLSGDVKSAKIATSWLDPETSTNYTNVFKVDNYCDNLPRTVGEEFYFYFIKKKVKTMECIVCQAVRATPVEGNEIRYTGTTCP